jgi:uncharacterized protein YbjT (DUF2867 family)
MSTHKICLLGGTGFVGRRVAARLSEAGHDVVILTRRRERHRGLLVLPTVRMVEGDVHDPEFLGRQFAGRDTVINLVGILNETGRRGSGFARAHVELPQKIVRACGAAGVARLLHMSALHASADAPSHYLRTKAQGEDAVHRAETGEFHVTSFRPSVIFGPEDDFLNRFAALLRLTPGVFPLACPEARFQPVYVENVVGAFVESLDNHKTFGGSYDLCGPGQKSLHHRPERDTIVSAGAFPRVRAGQAVLARQLPLASDRQRLRPGFSRGVRHHADESGGDCP